MPNNKRMRPSLTTRLATMPPIPPTPCDGVDTVILVTGESALSGWRADRCTVTSAHVENPGDAECDASLNTDDIRPIISPPLFEAYITSRSVDGHAGGSQNECH